MQQSNPLTQDRAQADLVGPALQYNIEQFLFLEAELLDDNQLDSWLALMTDDIHYFMPLRSNRSPRERDKEWSGPDEFAYFDDGKASLELRLRKLKTGAAWAEEPPSRTRHLITNVRVQARDIANEFEVKSNFLVYRNRSERQVDILAGERRDVLRATASEGQFKIAKRLILLDQATFLANNLSFFL
jgi:3-phenylpropionate/cinnamic acid dioxygenase small subunit